MNDGKTKRSCGKEWNNSKRQGVPNRVATRPKDREAHKEAFIQDKAKAQQRPTISLGEGPQLTEDKVK